MWMRVVEGEDKATRRSGAQGHWDTRHSGRRRKQWKNQPAERDRSLPLQKRCLLYLSICSMMPLYNTSKQLIMNVGKEESTALTMSSLPS